MHSDLFQLKKATTPNNKMLNKLPFGFYKHKQVHHFENACGDQNLAMIVKISKSFEEKLVVWSPADEYDFYKGNNQWLKKKKKR